jgi:hypothetical protein
MLPCSDSSRELGAGACRHRPEESPTIRGLTAGRPAIAGTVQECPVDEACAMTLPSHFWRERDFRDDTPLTLVTDLPHEPRNRYAVTAVDANVLETCRPRSRVRQEESLSPRTPKKHPPPAKLIQPGRSPHRNPFTSPLPHDQAINNRTPLMHNSCYQHAHSHAPSRSTHCVTITRDTRRTCPALISWRWSAPPAGRRDSVPSTVMATRALGLPPAHPNHKQSLFVFP